MKHRSREMYIVSLEGEPHLDSLTVINEKVDLALAHLGPLMGMLRSTGN
jgi:hypothetical protein